MSSDEGLCIPERRPHAARGALDYLIDNIKIVSQDVVFLRSDVALRSVEFLKW